VIDLTKKQAILIACPANEILFGGSRGGGKTSGLILDYINDFEILRGNSRGLFLRKTYKELEGCYDTFNQFLKPLKFAFNGSKNAYIHPSGATLKLGYLSNEADADNYQGHQYSWLGLDEVGNYKNFKGIDKLKSVLRGFSVPPRLVMSANPGGSAHELIKARFNTSKPNVIQKDEEGWTRVYIPSQFEDNFYLVEKDPDYLRRATENLPEYLKRAWRYGDWDISPEAGMFFSREDFEGKIVESNRLPGIVKVCRAWDRAASEPSPQYPDPDYTAGVKIAKGADGNFYVLDVKRRRQRSASIRSLIHATAQADGKGTSIVLFQDPGQAGKGEADDMKKLLAGHRLLVEKESGAKHIRWMSFSSAVQNGIVYLVKGDWNEEFVDELVSLTDNPSDYGHDDQADAASAAFNELTRGFDEDVGILDKF
jgi:predicted phage terminase large subunit-like protein